MKWHFADVFETVASVVFGERVTAVVSPRPGHVIDELALIAFARQRIAGYKTPRRVIVVDAVRRAANGKADYKWAKDTALEEVSALTEASQGAPS